MEVGLLFEFLAAHTNVHLHFTPTYSSWLNQVELWLAKIERDVIARGVFTSVPDLKRKLMRYIRQYNKDAKLVRRLFYPGALKDSRYANRYVALTIDPDDATRQPKWETTNVQPTRPVESDQDEFTPGIPLGTGAPSTLQPAPHSRTPATPAPPPAPGKQPRKRFLAPRKS